MYKQVHSEGEWPKVAIIVLNWNGWRDTIECLESINQTNYTWYDIIVVDNCSNDNSIEEIKFYIKGKMNVDFLYLEYSNKGFELLEAKIKDSKNKNLDNKIMIIKSDKNYRFAGGNNIALNYAMQFLSPKYILLLNNDTVVDSEFLRELVKVAENDDRIALVGPKIYYYDNPERINFIGNSINYWLGSWKVLGQNEIDRGQFDSVIDVDSINGCCVLIRCEVLRYIGLLDKRFPMGYEDVDISLRARKFGYKVQAAGRSKIWHKIGASRSKSKKSNKIHHYIKYMYYTFATKFYLIIKNWDGPKCVTALLFNVIYMPITIIYAKVKGL